MPQELLTFPPVYCIVGVYRLLTDPLIWKPVWDKCRHGVRRGGLVGLAWAVLTFKLQKAFVGYFLLKSPRFTGLSTDRVFGLQLPLDVGTYATLLFIGDQVTGIMYFFLSRNLRVARDRAWDQTLVSRGKGPEFWGAYIEEWQKPPRGESKPPKWEKWVGNPILRIAISKIVLAPLNFIPFLGLGIKAWMKALSTSRGLHSPYFKLKKMTPNQIATYMEERKWDYRAFGFVAALFESLPIIGIGMTISNRIASAMWAHDLEKRQDLFRQGELKPLPPRIITTENGETIELAPRATSQLNSSEKVQLGGSEKVLGGSEKVAGAWE